MPDDKPTCATCRFWNNYGQYGACHRFPPSIPALAARSSNFAESHEDDWCGEHQPRRNVVNVQTPRESGSPEELNLGIVDDRI